MANISGSSGMIRIDTSRMNEYLRPDKPKLSFFQKLGRGIGKAFSFLGPIGAAVSAIAIPGAGIPIAAGLYGLSNVSGRLTAQAEAKDAARANQAYSEASKKPVMLPGLFEQASQAQIQTDFMVPSSLQSQTQAVIGNREASSHNMTEGFDFYN